MNPTASNAADRLRIGLSGWSYPGWRAGFYKGVPQRRWLAHCAAHFNTLEVNASFYRAVRPDVMARWHDETPADFAFALKGHRYITHIRRLNDVAAAVARQRDMAQPLGDRLAVMLWQLPASFPADPARLESFARVLAEWPTVRHAIEFRHPSWFTPAVAGILERHHIANCLSDAPRWPMWQAVTSDTVYVRLHGHSRIYASRYATATLRRWAAAIRRWLGEGRTVFVYFDNDGEGHAPYDALRLKIILAGR